MTIHRIAAALTLGLLFAGAAAAQTALTPASPQPDGLKTGLWVNYAYPADVKTLKVARDWLNSGKEAGPPLIGLDYMDSDPGAPVLTSKRAEFVAAEIGGYVRFDQPGVWGLQIHSNDGALVTFGGAEVDRFNGRRPCDTNGWVEVSVPQAGWYAVSATYYQRLNTGCLMMRWRKPDGTTEWTPRDAWGFR
ncbi:MAG: hypothetical protein AAFU61_08770 [Pseudomonadota bacterium]